ncbi:MAG TPA: protein kinase [Polyangiaceae bacterium]
MGVDDPRATSGPGLEPTALAPIAGGAPATLLHYRVLGKIGEGGMGAVFKAEDQRLGRVVAIKRLSSGAEDEAGRRRLVREARAASALSHPNIVTVFAIEETAESTFIVMELLDGETLAAAISRGPLEPARVRAVGAEVADALACAHAQGLVHRDVKPANVVLTTRGAAKVLDFGLAKPTQVDPAHAVTAPDVVAGTAPYMSPEQLRGAQLDGRSDVFALGAVLYEAATGKRAFPGTDLASIVQQITMLDPAPPRTLAPDLPEALEAIILRALQKEPSNRFQSAKEMAAALRDPELRVAPAKGPVARTLSSVAVLPFLDLSAARDQEYLCDGIAEEVLTALTRVEGLRVAARSSSFQLKSQDARSAGARLGVDAVLEGAVRKSGDKLRVTVQLVETAGGYQRWSHRFDGVVADVFAIQDEIAAEVAKQLRGVLTSSAAHMLKRPETTPQAYEHFLRGRKLLREHGTHALVGAARELERAIELDPRYAPAWAALAQVRAMLVEWHKGGDDLREGASRASLRAVELGEELSEAHVARGAVLAMRGDFAAAARAFEEAIEKNPQSFDAHYEYGRLCFKTGDLEGTIRLYRRASEVQPEDFQCLILAAMPLKKLGRASEADTWIREGLRRAERALEVDPKNGRALILGAGCWVDLGDRERALDWSRRAGEAMPDDDAIGYNLACNYAKLGEADLAIASLEKVFTGGRFGQKVWVEKDPDFDSLRADPRFQALLARLP